MKKILSFVLVAVMLLSSLVIVTNAATPLGTVVEIPYSDKAPSMADALPDASWGESLIHVDKNSANAAITQYKQGGNYGKVKDNLEFDLYGMWTEDTLYLCMTSPDPDFTGGLQYWWGDCFQMILFPGIVDISYCNGAATGWTDKADHLVWDFAVSFEQDDETPSTSDAAEGHATIYGDEKTATLVAKFALPTTSLGYKKGDTLKTDDVFSFVMIRVDGSEADLGQAYVGWLEWGDFFNGKKGWDSNDKALYPPTAESSKTTTANTFKLVGGKSGQTTTQPPVEDNKPVDTKPAAEKPSSWAEAEVNKAIEAGLVPEALQAGYTKAATRENLSKMLAQLLNKVYGKAADKSDAKFTDTTDADVLYAANLGIINGYAQADGTSMFKPANSLKRSEMSAIVNRVAKLCGKTVTGYDSEVKFTDTATHWCKSELGWPVHVGIVKGTSDTTFSPENTLTMEQAIMMIYRAYEALK